MQTQTWRLAGAEPLGRGAEVAALICEDLIAYQDHGKSACYSLCSRDMLFGQLHGTACGGHYVPAGPTGRPAGHVLCIS